MAARRSVTEFAHVDERLGDALDTRLTVLVEEFALASERGAAGGSKEQPRIELGLELLYVAADGGAADAQAVAGPGKAAFTGNGKKGNDAGIAGGKAAGERVVRDGAAR